MAVIASLVLGRDGSSTLEGSSQALSSLADRERFLAHRRRSDVILIGGNTARTERYTKTPVPLVILSRDEPASLLEQNSLAHWWALSPVEAVARARWEFGSNIFIEGGIAFLYELLQTRLINQFELSITPVEGGENRINHLDLLAHFEKVEIEQVSETIFYTCTFPVTPQK